MQKRKKRFERAKAPVLDFSKSPNYELILYYVWRMRLLNSEQIALLTGRTTKKTNATLRDLFDAKFLLKAKPEFVAASGSQKHVYALDRKGAEYLRDYQGRNIKQRRWREDITKTSKFIAHRLMISDILIAFEQATQPYQNIELLYEEDVLSESPETTQEQKEPFNWKVGLESTEVYNLKVKLIPDAVMGLRLYQEDGTQTRYLFFLEADRGTEAIKAKSLLKSSIRKKCLSYLKTFDLGIQKEQYGYNNFRVLFITKTKVRATNIVDFLRDDLEGGRKGLFWLADLETLSATESIVTDALFKQHNNEEGTSLIPETFILKR